MIIHYLLLNFNDCFAKIIDRVSIQAKDEQGKFFICFFLFIIILINKNLTCAIRIYCCQDKRCTEKSNRALQEFK